MRYYEPQGHFRHFIIQLRESASNNQDCQTPGLFRQSILQTADLSQNRDSHKSQIQENGNKQRLCIPISRSSLPTRPSATAPQSPSPPPPFDYTRPLARRPSRWPRQRSRTPAGSDDSRHEFPSRGRGVALSRVLRGRRAPWVQIES